MSLPSLSTLSPEQIRVMCWEVSGVFAPKSAWRLTLDAVAELEAELTDEEFRKYRSKLETITNPYADGFCGLSGCIAAWERCETSASALQRASAFLLTKGLVTL